MYKIKEFTSFMEVTETLDKEISDTKSMLSKYLSRLDEVRHSAENLKKLHSTLSKVVGRKALKESLGEINVEDMTFVLDASPLDELNALEDGLERGIDRIGSGGRIAVISFHSLEDRLVKRKYQQESVDCICPADQLVCNCDHRARLKVITKRPLRPDKFELEANPRARSAKLRIAERI